MQRLRRLVRPRAGTLDVAHGVRPVRAAFGLFAGVRRPPTRRTVIDADGAALARARVAALGGFAQPMLLHDRLHQRDGRRRRASSSRTGWSAATTSERDRAQLPMLNASRIFGPRSASLVAGADLFPH
jgi:hypothetical protein